MTGVTETATETPDAGPAAGGVDGLVLLGIAATALVAGVGLTVTAQVGALALLVAVAVVQAAFGVSWIFGTRMPGRRGAVVVATLAAAGADVTVSMWPHGRLGTLLPVLGLAVPVMFVHQLLRGAARSQLISSLSAVALLVLGEVSLAALLQVRHEFDGDLGGNLASVAAGAALAAVLVGSLVDVVIPVPRFDPDVPRGLLGLVASAAVGAAVGQLLLRDETDFADGRGLFLGAAVGALAGLLAVATSFVQHTTTGGTSRSARVARPVFAALLPVALLAPAAFLLCLAIRA
jgi:hypothetical protein